MAAVCYPLVFDWSLTAILHTANLDVARSGNDPPTYRSLSRSRRAKLLQGIISFELHEERLRKLFADSNAMNRQFDVDRSDLVQDFERSTRILRRDKNGYVRLEQRCAKLPR